MRLEMQKKTTKMKEKNGAEVTSSQLPSPRRLGGVGCARRHGNLITHREDSRLQQLWMTFAPPQPR